MALLLARRNLGKYLSFLPYRPFRHLCALSEIRKVTPPHSCLPIARRIAKPNMNLIREVSTVITIDEYKSNRKYTALCIAERVAGMSLIFLIPLVFAVQSKELEMLLGLVGITHSYWGCQSMCNDYVRSAVVDRILPEAARILKITLSLATLLGFYYLIYEDCGIAHMIKKFWSIRGK